MGTALLVIAGILLLLALCGTVMLIGDLLYYKKHEKASNEETHSEKKL